MQGWVFFWLALQPSYPSRRPIFCSSRVTVNLVCPIVSAGNWGNQFCYSCSSLNLNPHTCTDIYRYLINLQRQWSCPLPSLCQRVVFIQQITSIHIVLAFISVHISILLAFSRFIRYRVCLMCLNTSHIQKKLAILKVYSISLFNVEKSYCLFLSAYHRFELSKMVDF